MINYYKILEIRGSAGANEIKEAYRKKALKYHPDVYTSSGAKSRFQEINEAYSVLIDPVSRQKYDMILEYGFERIAAAIKRHNAPKHKDPAYTPKTPESVVDDRERKNRHIKKDRHIILFENFLFASMVFIGIAFFIFAFKDMMARRWIEKVHGIAGLVTSTVFLVLLVIGWKKVLGRKYKL